MALSPALVRTTLITVAVVEALTWTGLLIGMLFKYVVADTEVGVKIFGPLHGAAFVAYVVAVLIAWRTFRWDLRIAVVALLASIPPFCSLLFERWADRTGRLRAGAASAVSR